MCYKIFTTEFGSNNIDRISDLRKAFPGMSFAAGIHKGQKGIWCLKDTVNRLYGEKIELENGRIFFLPTQDKLDEIKETLSNFKTPWVDRIKVKLKVGVTLEIYPATAIPKKVMLSLRKKQDKQEEESPYNKSHKYGRYAYSFLQKSQQDAEIRFDDAEFQEFIRCALNESYNLPIEIWDALELISMGDFDALFAAAMGFDFEHLQKELPLSNTP